MKKLITGIVWDNENAEALEHAIFDAPKVSKQQLEKMCQLTGVKYTQKEKNIDLNQLLPNLVEMELRGIEFICRRIDVYWELLDVSNKLVANITDLRNIVSKVNTRRKTKRDAKVLVTNYTTNISLWNNTINRAIIDEKMIPEITPLLRLAGYSGSIKPINEEDLYSMLPIFETDKTEVTLFSTKKRLT